MTAAVVIPNLDGERWLEGCLDSLAAQTVAPARIVVVDNGSSDGSLALLRDRYPHVQAIPLGRNTGFAAAVNRGVAAVADEAVAMLNTDVTLAPDWLERMTGALARDSRTGAVACKMLDMRDPGLIYDAGDILRRDGVCEQRGRFERDVGAFDEPGEVFAACAGAALYRRSALLDVGGFDERFFIYLEDVDIGLRLALKGWRCAYEPVVARHASGGSLAQLARSPLGWVERNTLLLAAKAFPLRWAPQVAYRQLAWAWHAARDRRLGEHLRAAASAAPRLPAMLRERRRLRATATVPVSTVIPARPIRASQGAR